MMRARFFARAFVLLHLSSSYAADIETCFTPGQDCQGYIVSEIGRAERFILIQGYGFTSAPIAQALIDAHKRGVDVRAILDEKQRTERDSAAPFLAKAGIEVLIDAKRKQGARGDWRRG